MNYGIATRRQLLDAGLSANDISRHVSSGTLVRLRRGWYASPDAKPKVASSVRVGGALACASALEFHGVWMRPNRLLHVSFDRGAHRVTPEGVIAHWCPSSREVLVEDALTAFGKFVRCGDPIDIVIAADSLINLGLASRSELESVLGRTARGRRILNRIDGRAESGTETIVRLRLRSRRVKLRTQVSIRSVGRVDLVVGDRLAIEVDGQTWHDSEPQFERDRARDARLVALGFVVLRFSYRRVIDDLAEVEREILAVVRAKDHLRRPRHERIARNYGKGVLQMR